MTPEATLDQLNGDWPPCASLLGAHAVSWKPEASELVIAFTVDERFCHSGNILQGGFSASMLDATMAYVALCIDEKIEHIPSLEIKVSYIAPGHPGTLLCTARPVRLGGSIGFLESELHQDGRLVATATGTYRIVRRKD